jgi:hypothetical protein
VHAAARERTADEHMFTVPASGTRAGTFRLQLFTAPGARPVAVATQFFPGEGDPLGTWAEEYASEVWRRQFPGSADPRSGSRCAWTPGRRTSRPSSSPW